MERRSNKLNGAVYTCLVLYENSLVCDIHGHTRCVYGLNMYLCMRFICLRVCVCNGVWEWKRMDDKRAHCAPDKKKVNEAVTLTGGDYDIRWPQGLV